MMILTLNFTLPHEVAPTEVRGLLDRFGLDVTGPVGWSGPGGRVVVRCLGPRTGYTGCVRSLAWAGVRGRVAMQARRMPPLWVYPERTDPRDLSLVAPYYFWSAPHA